MIKLKCLVLDDEPLARKGIHQFILRTPFLAYEASARNSREAMEQLLTGNIDLLFLDIEMPGMDGIAFLQSLPVKPCTIIITAHPQFAVQGFELNVADYLLKPVSYERFVVAVNKVLKIRSPQQTDEFIFIKNGTGQDKIKVNDIDYIEARGNYVLIHTVGQSILAYLSLKAAIGLLPGDRFMKVHKSFIVALPKVTRIEARQLWLYKQPIPISRNLQAEVGSRLLNRMQE